jgi:hypothetical protein
MIKLEYNLSFMLQKYVMGVCNLGFDFVESVK